MSRGGILVGTALAAEIGLYLGYVGLGAQYHYWLHGLVGAAAGLGALTVRILLGRAPVGTGAVVSAALAGHLLSAVPDVLFRIGRLPHQPWMDLFLFHIRVHLVPWPLVGALAVLLITSGALVSAMYARRVAASAALGAAVIIAVSGLVAAAPIPDSIQDFDHHMTASIP